MNCWTSLNITLNTLQLFGKGNQSDSDRHSPDPSRVHRQWGKLKKSLSTSNRVRGNITARNKKNCRQKTGRTRKLWKALHRKRCSVHGICSSKRSLASRTISQRMGITPSSGWMRATTAERRKAQSQSRRRPRSISTAFERISERLSISDR